MNILRICLSLHYLIKLQKKKEYNDFCWPGEAICSVYIQPEGFGPPPQQQMGGYRKEFAQTFQSTEQKTQTGTQSFQQRSYQQTIDKRSYVNGTSVSIEDFKVSISFI